MGLQALPSRRSRRVKPRQWEFLAAKSSLFMQSRVAFRSPPCTPFGESACQWDKGYVPADAPLSPKKIPPRQAHATFASNPFFP